MKHALTIAGSDSCGGAGIQADIKAMSALGVYAMSVITAVTAQNTMGVFGVEEISPEMVGAQIDAVFEDIRVDAVKIGMVSAMPTIGIIADKLQEYQYKNIVLDPVMISKSGCALLKPESMDALKARLIPLAALITPNIPEAEALTGMKITSLEQMKEASEKLLDLGPGAVLVKGGHYSGDSHDVLNNGGTISVLTAKRIPTKNTHGTGCTLSSAIAARLALGDDVGQAVAMAKKYITGAIEHSFSPGKGVGPVNHFYKLYKQLEVEDD